jgi:hypothetical protein
MPYKSEKKGLLIPKELDRRCKLTEEDKENIREMYYNGCFIREIARHYEGICSRRLIQFVLFPERAEKVKQQYKERGGSVLYYDRKRHNKAMREHRRHKYNLLLQNKLEKESD